jgi:type IV pilus assembly protein PilC
MAVFKYQAINRGQRKEGTLTAENPQDANARLRAQGFAILKLTEVKSFSGRDDNLIVERSSFEKKTAGIFTKKIHIEQTMQQLASLLTAGVPILTALKIAAKQAPWYLSRALQCVASKVSSGASFSEALKKEAPFIGDISIGLVSVGEANGSLDQMCLFAASLLERRREVRDKIIQALSYPAVVVLIALGTGYFLMVKVIPKITKFIAMRAGEMPAVTQMLIDFSNFIKSYGIFLSIVPFFLVAVFFIGRKNPLVGSQIDFALLKIPLFGKVFIASSNAVWTRTLGMLLRSGINVISAIVLTQNTLRNLHVKKQFVLIKDVVEQGQPLSTGMQVSTLASLSPLAEAMIQIGENTGTVDDGLLHVAKFSEEELDRRLALLVKLVEPALFIVVGGMVGFVYIAFFMGLMAASRSI